MNKKVFKAMWLSVMAVAVLTVSSCSSDASFESGLAKNTNHIIVIGDIIETSIVDSSLIIPTVYEYKTIARMKVRNVVDGHMDSPKQIVEFSFMAHKTTPNYLRYNHVMCMLEETPTGYIANDWFGFVDVYKTSQDEWVTAALPKGMYLYDTLKKHSQSGARLKRGEYIALDILEDHFIYASASRIRQLDIRMLYNSYKINGNKAIPTTVIPAGIIATYMKNKIFPEGNIFDAQQFIKANEMEHTAVDMGLSVQWATCNVGATQKEEIGGYYAWGETEQKLSYTEQEYKWYNENYTKYSKDVDNNVTLTAVDDVATSAWGQNWRTPSSEEFQELIDNCTYLIYSINGIIGCAFTSKINNNQIFLPLAGSWEGKRHYRYGENVENEEGCYMSSSIDVDDNTKAKNLVLWQNKDPFISSESRSCGLSVRPVYDPK